MEIGARSLLNPLFTTPNAVAPNATPTAPATAAENTATQTETAQTETAQTDQQREEAEQTRRQEASEQRVIAELAARDRQVRAHEAAHLAAAGAFAQGGPTFTFQQGPDGRQYAIGGAVRIDTSAIAGDPAATIRKAQTIRRAALAPAEPSGQDQAVAGQAAQLEARARAEQTQESQEEQAEQQEEQQAQSADPRSVSAIVARTPETEEEEEEAAANGVITTSNQIAIERFTRNQTDPENALDFFA